MPRFETSRRVPFSADQMFAVVADIECYPEFLPLCEGLVVHSREQSGTTTKLIATMSIGYKAIRENFKSRVTLKPQQHQIVVSYLDGPFEHLENQWTFRDIGNGSEVSFFIDYAFASRMLGMLMGAVFDKAVRKYADAFEDRARHLYGRVAANTEPGGARNA